MNQADFTTLFDATIETCRQLLIVKGGEYAGTDDRLSNFKRGALRTGASAEQVLWIYLSKHLDSIETYIRDQRAGVERPRSEAIEGRVDDAINYLLLFKGLLAWRGEGC